MPSVHAISSSLISSLGMDPARHWAAIQQGRTGIRQYEDAVYSPAPFMASRLDPSQWQIIQAGMKRDISLSPFEQMAIYACTLALQQLAEPIDLNKTALILSTTKGNIEWLGTMPDERLLLSHSALLIAKQLGIASKPIAISHACVSGVAALTYGMRLIESGRYKHTIVVGCDRFSRFVLSGFQSFQAISAKPCRPFDAARDGITLGEAASAIILSSGYDNDPIGQLLSGAMSNDANHISGPSRTGEELADAITRALHEAQITPAQVDMISAHGTATIYNDEMEARAFDVAGVLNSPLFSFKGYIGHTLGAAGIAESVICLEAMRNQCLVPSLGYDNLGVPKPVNVIRQMQPASITHVLKTASGFGGSNAAIVWKAALL